MGAHVSSHGTYGQSAVVAEGSGLSGATRRQTKYKDGLKSSAWDDVSTLYEGWQRGLKAGEGHAALGYRPVKKSEVVDGKEVITVADDFVWFSYAEIQDKIDKLGAGMLHLELAPKNDMGHKLIGIYSKNRWEYTTTIQACNAFSMSDCPLYDTLGSEAVAFIIGQTLLYTVFASRTEVVKLCKFKKEHAADMACLKNVVQFEDASEVEKTAASAAGLTLRSFAEVMEVGAAHPTAHRPPKPEDLAFLCYTSGTTGTPKGAIITHGNMVADASGAVYVELDLSEKDSYLSYLPLAHVMERLVQAALTASGARLGFFQGDTLKLMDDIKVLRPTIFVSVPRLYNRIYERVTGGANEKGGIALALFNAAVAGKKYWLAKGYLHHTAWDALVFDGIRKRVGLDRCRLMITGSAPLASHVMEFMRIVFGCAFVEGYGQTECGGAAFATATWDCARTGHVGTPLACNEVKLVSVPEMGYNVGDTIHGRDVRDGVVVNEGMPCEGRGEVCYRGPNVFPGYYKDPAKTAEVIDADKWLHSGDIGLWDMDGNLRIIDRKKNIFKLSQGEYVAAEKIENVYLKCPYIAQVFVHGDSLHAVLVAIVVPSEDQVKSWAKHTNGKEHISSVEEAVADPDFKNTVLADITRVGKEGKLLGFELVKEIYLDPTPWTPDTLLTPTFKLKRNDAKLKYAAQIDEMYSRVDQVAGKSGLKQGHKH